MGGQDNIVPIFSLHFHRLSLQQVFFQGGIGRENRISEPVFKMLKMIVLAQSFANTWDRSQGKNLKSKQFSTPIKISF